MNKPRPTRTRRSGALTAVCTGCSNRTRPELLANRLCPSCRHDPAALWLAEHEPPRPKRRRRRRR